MLLLAGCSFVNDPNCHLTGFGSDAHDYNKCRIISRSGAGNHYISHSILSHLNPDITEVFVLFSGLSRIDIPMPLSNVNLVDFSNVSLEDDCIWLHSGGWAGTWTLEKNKNPDGPARYFKDQYYALDWQYLNRQSLMRVVGCLSAVELMKIPYTWGFIYDIYQDYTDSDTSLGAAVSRDDPILRLLPWHRFVDPPPYEFCRDRGLLDIDGFHPSLQGWQIWFDALGRFRPNQ